MGAEFGVAGLIVYTDPKDINDGRAGENDTYPNSWHLPPSGVERGSYTESFGDLLTPYYPAKGTWLMMQWGTRLPDLTPLPRELGEPRAPSRLLGLPALIHQAPLPGAGEGALVCPFSSGAFGTGMISAWRESRRGRLWAADWQYRIPLQRLLHLSAGQGGPMPHCSGSHISVSEPTPPVQDPSAPCCDPSPHSPPGGGKEPKCVGSPPAPSDPCSDCLSLPPIPEFTYRINESEIQGIPPIPTQPIGFEDARTLIWWVTGHGGAPNPRAGRVPKCLGSQPHLL